MSSYTPAPKAPHSPIREPEAATRRAPQGPPRIDSGARRNIYGPGAQAPLVPRGLPVSLRQVGQVYRAIGNDREMRDLTNDVHTLAHPDTLHSGPLGRPGQPAVSPSTVRGALGPGPVGIGPAPRPHPGPVIAGALGTESYARSGARERLGREIPASGVTRPQGQHATTHELVNPDQSKGRALNEGPHVAGPGPRAHGQYGPSAPIARLNESTSTGDFDARLGTSATFDKSKAIEVTGREASTPAAPKAPKPASTKGPSKPRAPRAKKG